MVIAQVRKVGNKTVRYKMRDIKAGKVHPKGKLLGYQVLHHRTIGLIGKPINATKKPVSYAKALSIHRAIMARRHG
jgi:hypothetical protein